MTTLEGSTLSAAELVALVESGSLAVDAGLELLDSSDTLIEDISDDFMADGSSVDRGIYRTIHGTARLNVSRDIQWGSQRLRPYLLLSDDGTTWYRWNLGVFLPTVPERQVVDDTPVWSVDCFDKLDLLNTPHGATYSLAAGENVVDAVELLIEEAGETLVKIEPSAVTSGSTRVMSLADDWTTLGICNELLDSIGHRALYMDNDGRFCSEAYRAPVDLPTVWSYSTASASTTVGEQRSTTSDYYQAANWIVGIRDAVEDAIPVEGDGIHVAFNQSDGLTSIDGRGGRIIRRVIKGEYANHAALVTAVEAALDAERRVANYVQIDVGPTPVHGHFDVVLFRDDAIPVSGRFLVTDWTLPLGGGDMTLSLRGV